MCLQINIYTASHCHKRTFYHRTTQKNMDFSGTQPPTHATSTSSLACEVGGLSLTEAPPLSDLILPLAQTPTFHFRYLSHSSPLPTLSIWPSKNLVSFISIITGRTLSQSRSLQERAHQPFYEHNLLDAISGTCEQGRKGVEEEGVSFPPRWSLLYCWRRLVLKSLHSLLQSPKPPLFNRSQIPQMQTVLWFGWGKPSEHRGVNHHRQALLLRVGWEKAFHEAEDGQIQTGESPRRRCMKTRKTQRQAREHSRGSSIQRPEPEPPLQACIEELTLQLPVFDMSTL